MFNKPRPLASDEYYNRRMLRLSSSIDEIGPVEWDLALCLLLAWVISFLCMVKGIKTTGKVVYFTAVFPYVVLIILLIKGVTLENAGTGLIYFLRPNFSRLADASVWSDAAIQMFFAMSNCWGGLIALASYNRFHSNCHRDTLIVTLTNFFTGILAGLVIFSFLGYMAGEMGKSIEEVVDQGPGLAFIVYPYAVTKMPVSPLWAILFFLMLLTIGLDSQFCALETVLTAIIDQFTPLRPHKSKVIFTLCVVLFLVGLPLCTHGGNYLLQLMDNYCSGWNLLLIGLIESIAVAWVYGAGRFSDDIRIMLGKKPGDLWWKLNWLFFSPIFLAFVLIFQWVKYRPPSYGSQQYPAWAEAMGWLMTISSVIWIPIVAVVLIYREMDGTICQRIRSLCVPTKFWGPALIRHRKLVDYVQDFDVNPWNEDQPNVTVQSDPTVVTVTRSNGTNTSGSTLGSLLGAVMARTGLTWKSLYGAAPVHKSSQSKVNDGFSNDVHISQSSDDPTVHSQQHSFESHV